MAKVQEKNGNRSFYPSAKSRTEPKMFSSGVIFRDGSASDAQKFIAIPKTKILLFGRTPHPLTESPIGQKFKKIFEINLFTPPPKVIEI